MQTPYFSGIIKFFQENEILKKKHQEQLDNVFNQDSNRESIQEANFIEPQIPPTDPLMLGGTSLGKPQLIGDMIIYVC